MAPQDIPISDSAAQSSAGSAAGSAVGSGAARLVCPGCAAPGAVELEEFRSLSRVTSDCRAWPAGGRLAVCGACGLAFKPFDAAFRADAEKIYSSYAIYHQSGGHEQRVRHPRTGGLVPRSAVLAEMLLDRAGLPGDALPERGSLLDVGCGNGAFLRAFAAARPGWELRGTEHDRRHAAELAQIPGFRELLPGEELAEPSGGLSAFKDQKFDLITLIHVLEHARHPVAWLTRLRMNLRAGGALFIECPDAEQNPFDLLTADHALHFSRSTLAATMNRAGVRVDLSEKPWIAKELSAVCKATDGPPSGGKPGSTAARSVDPKEAIAQTRRNLAWLRTLLTQARTLAAREPIGCFGTSIAGTWLAGELEDRIGFFVDEDPDRAGSNYLGRAVDQPDRVRSGSTVLLALAPSVARDVEARLAPQFPKVRFVTPEPVPAA